MSDSAERLTAADFEAAMDLLNRAFAEHGAHDFARMLPARYQPTDGSMGHHVAIRRRGRIAALLGIFPIEWRLGDEVLRVAGIGGVAVDPDHRGQGLMGRLLEYARDAIRDDGFHLSFLSGQRQRYLRYGWERAGTRLRYVLHPRNLCSGPPTRPLELERPRDNDENVLRELHDAQPTRCCRPAERFGDFLRGWNSDIWVARTAHGTVRGYLSCSEEQESIAEVVGDSVATSHALLRAWATRSPRTHILRLPLSVLPLARQLAEVAEVVSVETSGNWWVLDWPRVAGALLAARATMTPLPPGRVVLSVEGQRFTLAAEGESVQCETTRQPVDLELATAAMTRLLFGPTAPEAVVPRVPAALQGWCPLPLALPRLDEV